jgi:hypothetical protein
MLRVAGDVDHQRLLEFLDKNAFRMPSIMLSYAAEKLDPTQREHYRANRKSRHG